jgi:hypothetical protein
MGGRFAVRRNEWSADAGVLPEHGQNQLVTMDSRHRRRNFQLGAPSEVSHGWKLRPTVLGRGTFLILLESSPRNAESH